jgi:threonylcarbamoyladenosine tRNA methylthiotransferase MtaB
MRASFYTLGCRLNQAETAIMAKSVENAGYKIVEFGQPADLTVINTCTVTEQADAKCRQAVRKTLRQSPGSFVAVVGCYAQMAVETLRRIKGVDLIIGNEHKLALTDYLDGLEKKSQPLIVHSPKIGRQEFVIETYGLYDNATRANLKIQDGCNFVCNFCIIPTARGPARSRKPGDILREADQLVEMGHREIVLTGVNIGTYESEGQGFMDVLKALEKVDGLERLRISSIEPTTIPRELISYIGGSEKICNHLHIPLQSGDDRILKSMRRRYTAAEYAAFIEFVYNTIPGVGIGTDVMVGYPGENEEAFINTKKILADLPVAYCHVFTYSDRRGTGSFKITQKVDSQVKKQRTRILIEQGNRKKYAYAESFLGKNVPVLFEQRQKNGNWSGHTGNYLTIEAASREDLHNQIRMVRIVSPGVNAVAGELVDAVEIQ